MWRCWKYLSLMWYVSASGDKDEFKLTNGNFCIKKTSRKLNKIMWGKTVEIRKLEKKHDERIKKHYVLMRTNVKLKDEMHQDG